MSTRHTPGPWTYTGFDIVSDSANKYVATPIQRKGTTPEEVNANARLIASAPALLAALESLLPHAARRIQGTTDGDPVLAVARAAIAAARGEG